MITRVYRRTPQGWLYQVELDRGPFVPTHELVLATGKIIPIVLLGYAASFIRLYGLRAWQYPRGTADSLSCWYTEGSGWWRPGLHLRDPSMRTLREIATVRRLALAAQAGVLVLEEAGDAHERG